MDRLIFDEENNIITLFITNLSLRISEIINNLSQISSIAIQRDMAFYAKAMMFIGILGLFISMVGTFYLIATLRQTRNATLASVGAANAGEKAAAAAVASNEHNEKLNQPIITLVFHKPNEHEFPLEAAQLLAGNHREISLYFYNMGKSVGEVLEVCRSWSIALNDIAPDYIDHQAPNLDAKKIIRWIPGENISDPIPSLEDKVKILASTKGISPRESENVTFSFQGWVKFRDRSFGKEYVFGFSYFANKSTGYIFRARVPNKNLEKYHYIKEDDI